MKVLQLLLGFRPAAFPNQLISLVFPSLLRSQPGQACSDYRLQASCEQVRTPTCAGT
jgi:hypothetical protein